MAIVAGNDSHRFKKRSLSLFRMIGNVVYEGCSLYGGLPFVLMKRGYYLLGREVSTKVC